MHVSTDRIGTSEKDIILMLRCTVTQNTLLLKIIFLLVGHSDSGYFFHDIMIIMIMMGAYIKYNRLF